MSRLAVVTGGSRGIGAAVARLLASKGCRVAVLSRDLDAARAAVASLEGDGHVALSCDVSQELEVKAAFQEILQSCGKITYLVNSAGINRDGLLLRQRASDMRPLLEVNLMGSMLTCRAALPSMLRSPGAAVLNIGSVVGLKGRAGQCVYAASKAGLEGFTRSLAKEVGVRGVRVNMLLPGFIRTSMTEALQASSQPLPIPLGRVGEVEEVAQASSQPLPIPLGRVGEVEEALQASSQPLPIPLGRVGEVEEVAQAALFLLLSPYVTGQALLVDGGVGLHM